MKPIKQTVYVPVNGNYTTAVCVFDFDSWVRQETVVDQEGYLFTPQQLNEYTANVIKQTLETAAERAKLIKPDKFGTCESSIAYTEVGEVYISSKSITNTFEETFKKFEV